MNTKEVKKLISQFEDGSFPKEKWTHKAHFVMALWYTYHEPIYKARQLIKEGIKNYNVSVGGENTEDSGYHETITELYIQIIIQYQMSFANSSTFEELLNLLNQQEFMEKNFPFKFYTKELLMSKEARKQWVEPNKKDLLSFKYSIGLDNNN